jgi:uncharacterized protein YeaO (DUF488 family)
VKTEVNIKRVYEEPNREDGFRILIDRLWPRGLKKADAQIDEWAKLLAPSTELRKWFGHDPDRWKDFEKKYLSELKSNNAATSFVKDHADRKVITLVYGASDPDHNNALVLQHFLKAKFK